MPPPSRPSGLPDNPTPTQVISVVTHTMNHAVDSPQHKLWIRQHIHRLSETQRNELRNQMQAIIDNPLTPDDRKQALERLKQTTQHNLINLGLENLRHRTTAGNVTRIAVTAGAGIGALVMLYNMAMRTRNRANSGGFWGGVLRFSGLAALAGITLAGLNSIGQVREYNRQFGPPPTV